MRNTFQWQVGQNMIGRTLLINLYIPYIYNTDRAVGITLPDPSATFCKLTVSELGYGNFLYSYLSALIANYISLAPLGGK